MGIKPGEWPAPHHRRRFLALAEVLGFDPHEVLAKVIKARTP
jgi:hypothetical protein